MPFLNRTMRGGLWTRQKGVNFEPFFGPKMTPFFTPFSYVQPYLPHQKWRLFEFHVFWPYFESTLQRKKPEKLIPVCANLYFSSKLSVFDQIGDFGVFWSFLAIKSCNLSRYSPGIKKGVFWLFWSLNPVTFPGIHRGLKKGVLTPFSLCEPL